MKTHTAEVKVLMDLFTKYKGKMTPSELMTELKETKMRQVYDYLYWADREQGIVIKSHRTGRTVVAYEHVSGEAQAVTEAPVKAAKVTPAPKPDAKVVRLALKKALNANVVAVAKAAAKKVKPAKVIKSAAAKKAVSAPKVSPVVEKPRKGEVSSYAVDADFDRDDALAIPDFLKRK